MEMYSYSQYFSNLSHCIAGAFFNVLVIHRVPHIIPCFYGDVRQCIA